MRRMVAFVISTAASLWAVQHLVPIDAWWQLLVSAAVWMAVGMSVYTALMEGLDWLTRRVR